MESVLESRQDLFLHPKDAQNASSLLSSESVLHILRLILAGAPLSDVLTIIARLVESGGDGTLCTIWLPHEDGKQLYCAAAPSLPGFISGAGSMTIGPKGGSCGTAVYRREPVYVNDILADPSGIIIVTGSCLLEFEQCGRARCLRAKAASSERSRFIIVKCAVRRPPMWS